MKPIEVNHQNENQLLKTVYNYKRPIGTPLYKIGDYVRVSKQKHIYSKGFMPSFSPQLYRIISRNIKVKAFFTIKKNNL